MGFALTLDYDWASEAVLEMAVKPLVEAGIKVTLFSTHESAWVNGMWARHSGKIELEIHPNFLAGSSQGQSMAQVLESCDRLTSEKMGYRCHKYYNDNDVQETMTNLGYKYSSNICTDLQYVPPFRTRTGLLEIPIYMEDGGFLYRKHDLSISKVISNVGQVGEGTIVFLFHPMHIAFNSNSYVAMRALKRELSRDQYQNITAPFVNSHRNRGYGVANILEELIEWKERNGVNCVLMKEIHD